MKSFSLRIKNGNNYERSINQIRNYRKGYPNQ
jgi:hypothetical protein